jgi:hypothetical protein
MRSTARSRFVISQFWSFVAQGRFGSQVMTGSPHDRTAQQVQVFDDPFY